MTRIVCYLRQGPNVFETYWTTIRGVEAIDNSYRLLDLRAAGGVGGFHRPAGRTDLKASEFFVSMDVPSPSRPA
jgi:hypothetical protein